MDRTDRMPRPARALAPILALAIGLGAATAPAAAQDAAAATLLVTPRVGAHLPLRMLARYPVGAGQESRFELGAGPALGLAAELSLPRWPVNVRANFDVALGAGVEQTGVGAQSGDATVLAVVADVVYRPLPRLQPVSPYLFLGAGLRRYAFDLDETAAGFPADDTAPALHLGGGADFGLGPLALAAEAGLYASRFEPDVLHGGRRVQHDLFLRLGVRFGMF
jgi:hypothetical protein